MRKIIFLPAESALLLIAINDRGAGLGLKQGREAQAGLTIFLQVNRCLNYPPDTLAPE
jgi:hypothetical protein